MNSPWQIVAWQRTGAGSLALAFLVLVSFLPDRLRASDKTSIGSAESTLAVQILVDDRRLSVTQVLNMPSPADEQSAVGRFPLLLPETGPGPDLKPRTESNPNGIDTSATPGARVVFGTDGLEIHGKPGTTGFQVKVRYTVPVTDTGLAFRMTPSFDLGTVQFITKRNSTYGMQLRPLIPYSYREEVEEDGTWQYMTSLRAVEAGSSVRATARHLPSPFGTYRTIGVVAVFLAAVILGLTMLSRNRKNRAI